MPSLTATRCGKAVDGVRNGARKGRYVNLGVSLISPRWDEARPLTSEQWEAVHFVTGSGHIFPVEVQLAPTNPSEAVQFQVRTDVSGRIYVPIGSPAEDAVLTATGTLPPRQTAYHLLLEICRGRLFQLREISHSLPLDGALREESRELHHQFRQLLFTSNAPVDRVLAFLSVASRFEFNWLNWRGEMRTRISRHGIVVREDAASPRETYDEYCLVPSWPSEDPNGQDYNWESLHNRISHLAARGSKIFLGPLVDFRTLPAWIRDSDASAESCAERLSQWVRSAMTHFRSIIAGCLVWSGVSDPNIQLKSMPLDDDRLRLCVKLLEAAGAVGNGVPLYLGVDFPWCDHLLRGGRLIEFQLLDAIARARFGLAGLVLECDAGWKSHQSFPRTAIEHLSVFQEWFQIGLPLTVWLRGTRNQAYLGGMQAAMISSHVARVWRSLDEAG